MLYIYIYTVYGIILHFPQDLHVRSALGVGDWNFDALNAAAQHQSVLKLVPLAVNGVWRWCQLVKLVLVYDSNAMKGSEKIRRIAILEGFDRILSVWGLP